MDTSEKLPTHAKCPECGDEGKLDPYAYAHWDIELCRECPCGVTIWIVARENICH